MQIFRFELKKIFLWRPLWVIIFVLLIVNGYIIVKQQNEATISPANYMSLYNEIDDMSDEEKLDYIQNSLDTFWEDEDNLEKTDIQSRYELLSEFQQQLENILGYSEYIESVSKSSKSSIFNISKDSFAYKSNQKISVAYSDMSDVEPVFDISEGVLLSTENKIADIMCVFLIFISVICLIVHDKECGIVPLIRSSSNGRFVLAFNQLVVILVSVSIITAIFYFENIVFGFAYYGFGDVFRPIQSVSGYIACNLHINVLGYMIIYYITKVIALWLVGVVFAVVCLCSKSNIFVYALSIAISSVAICAYFFIQKTSVFNLLHYINPVNFIFVSNTFKQYFCINIFNAPFSGIKSIYFLMALILILLGIVFIILSEKIKNVSYKNISILNKVSSFFNMRKHQFTGFGYTIYNSTIVQKSAFVLVIFIAIISVVYVSLERPYDIDDMYYKYYCTQLEDKNDQEISSFLESEKERYESLHDEFDMLVNSSKSTSKIEKQLVPENAFQKVYSRATFLSELNESNTAIFYDTGYERLLSLDSRETLIFTIIKTVALILLIAPLFAFNNMYGLSKVIVSTAAGKQKYIIHNVILTFIYSMFISIAMDLFFFLGIIREYGAQGIDKSVYSVEIFNGFPINVKLKSAIIIIIALKALITFLVSLLILFISYYSRSVSSSSLISLFLFAAPILIAILNIDAFLSIGFTPFLIGTKVIFDFNLNMLIVPVLIIIFLVFWFIIKTDRFSDNNQKA